MSEPAYGIIFDVDGVLIDSYQAHFDAWNIIGQQRGFSIDEETFARSFGRTSREAIVDVFGMRELSAEEIKDLDEVKEAKYRDLLAGTFPELPGAGKFIDALHAAGFRIGVGSSGPPPNVDLVVDKLARRNKISGIVTGRDVSRGKPDPQVFLLASQRMGISPARCCVVEDAPAGIQAAHRAGMKCIAVTSTGRTAEEQHEAELIVPSLENLTPARVRQLIDG